MAGSDTAEDTDPSGGTRGGMPAAPAFTRVCVVAPRMRIDLALPADVTVAELLPTLLDMARESSADGGARHGGWCLARVGQAPLEPARTLAQARVLDGELLQLRRRADLPPAPLFDDVIDAVAMATPASYRPWTPVTARYTGALAAVAALLCAAVAVYLAGPGTVPAVSAGVVAALGAGAAGVLRRVYDQTWTATLLAACALPFAFVAGL